MISTPIEMTNKMKQNPIETARPLPKLDFTTFVLSVSSAALMELGIAPPGYPAQEDEFKVNLEMARQNIDLLELLEDKTKGNLSVDETKLIEQLLFETRMRYVEVEKREPKNA